MLSKLISTFFVFLMALNARADMIVKCVGHDLTERNPIALTVSRQIVHDDRLKANTVVYSINIGNLEGKKAVTIDGINFIDVWESVSTHYFFIVKPDYSFVDGKVNQFQFSYDTEKNTMCGSYCKANLKVDLKSNKSSYSGLAFPTNNQFSSEVTDYALKCELVQKNIWP